MTVCALVWAEDTAMDRHSRRVQIFKVLLPLTALALLSTLFLLSDSIDPQSTIPFAEGDAIERIRDQQITGPVYSGTTEKGDEIMFTADTVTPGGPYSPAEAINPRAEMVLSGGNRIKLGAKSGHLSLTQQMATFVGDVVITTADGMKLTTHVLNTSIEKIAGSAPGYIEGHGPIGELSAGGMELGSQSDDGAIHVLFTGGVKLIYDPQKSER